MFLNALDKTAVNNLDVPLIFVVARIVLLYSYNSILYDIFNRTSENMY